MAGERYHATLQENLVTLLAYDDKHGRIVSNMLDTNLMEGDYRLIAERCIDYWRAYKTAPKDHTADLMSDIIEDARNRRAPTIKRILFGIVELSKSINTDYVMNQLSQFTRMQMLKSAIIESAEKINSQAQMAITDIEAIWEKLLRTQQQNFEPGLRLSDYNTVLARLSSLENEFYMGIDELDSRHVVPARGQLLLIVAPAGRGKTWTLIHIGKTALFQRKKVLHLTLEVDDAYVAQRYYQNIFGITKRDESVEVTTLDVDMDRLEGFERKVVKPPFNWQWREIREELRSHIEHFGVRRFENLIIKRFAAGTLSVGGLRAYLDTLEMTEGFIPDMIICDYPRLMKVNSKDLRISLGNLMVELRGLAVERNVAFVAAHQSSKAGEEATMVTTAHIAEDWSIVGTADVILTYSCSQREFQYGLGRIFVGKCRSEEDRFTVLVTQSYKMGQFCMESHLLRSNYNDQLEALADADGDSYGSDDSDDSAGDDDE